MTEKSNKNIMRAKKIARFAIDTHLWNPAKAWLLARHYLHSSKPSGLSNRAHIQSAIDWLKRAQKANHNGGIAGRYLLRKNWTDSYPETSGYIIPTLLKAGKLYNDSDCIIGARKIVNFLLNTQLKGGAFPGGEYGDLLVSSNPVVFNTGQIVLGLLSWYRMNGDELIANAVKRAADWLVQIQEKDGSWEKHTYLNLKTAYHSRVAWPLALCGLEFSENKYSEAAGRFIEWLLKNANKETGWVNRMGFYEEDHQAGRSITHTLAYTYRGLWEYALLTDREDIKDLVFKANENIIGQFMKMGFMPGVFTSDWGGDASYTCLTGNCQLSIIWLKLYETYKDRRFYKAAEMLLNQVKSWQSISNIDSGIRGGISGSGPIWGEYIKFGFPNWAANFFIDAMMRLENIRDKESQKRDTESK